MAQDMFFNTPVYQHIFTQGKEQGHQEVIQSMRTKLLTLVEQRFPKLKKLATKQLAPIEQHQILEDLFLKIALAPTQEEVQDCLLTWDGQSEA